MGYQTVQTPTWNDGPVDKDANLLPLQTHTASQLPNFQTTDPPSPTHHFPWFTPSIPHTLHTGDPISQAEDNVNTLEFLLVWYSYDEINRHHLDKFNTMIKSMDII